MRGSRSKIPRIILVHIYDVKFLALLGVPCIYDISRLRLTHQQGVMIDTGRSVVILNTVPPLSTTKATVTNILHVCCSQYSETNVMQYFFNLLRTKGIYMYRALLAHPHEALHKRHLVRCLRVMSVGCTGSTSILVQPTDITHTQYSKCRMCSAS
jgi:hypothetical protein